MKLKFLLPLLITLIILFSCIKDEQENNESHFVYPEEIVSLYNLKDQSHVSLNSRVGIEFSYPIYNGQTTSGTSAMLKIDSAALVSENNIIFKTDSLTINTQSCSFLRGIGLSPGTTYTFYIKVHFVEWNGSTWTDVYTDSQIKYYERSYQFQTLIASIIASIYPFPDATSVPVFSSPYLAANFPFDKSITLPNSSQQFRIVLQSFDITQNNTPVPGNTNILDSIVRFIPNNWLSEATSFNMAIDIKWQKLVDGTWSDCLDLQDEIIGESVSRSFTTGGGSSTLWNDEDIIATYPVDRQYHFLKSETPYGYVLFTYPMDNFFANATNGLNYKYQVRFTENKTNTHYVKDMEYTSANQTAKFFIPQELKNETIYQLDFYLITNSDDTIDLKSIDFRTSKYNDFKSKINDLLQNGTTSMNVLAQYAGYNNELMFLRLNNTINNELIECFDKAEARIDPETNGQTGMARLEIVLDSNEFYLKYVYPVLYKSWLGEPFIPKFSRDPVPFGIPPVHAAYIDQPDYSEDAFKELSEEEIETNLTSQILLTKYIYFMFNNQPIYNEDEDDLEKQFSEHYINQAVESERGILLLSTNIPWYTEGNYQFKIKYVLPGLNTVSSYVKFNCILSLGK
ncbi:MAG: hypothetical protein JXB49_02015 [Bacteroidales bacterium]|nr:hypothetical protein [Bacteroidales bacterium]